MRGTGRRIVEESRSLRVPDILAAFAKAGYSGSAIPSGPRTATVGFGPPSQRSGRRVSFRLESTPQHFGGVRWWFVCSCGKRCTALYRIRDGYPFHCRQCNGLAYRTQNVSRSTRWLLRADKLLARAGCDRADGRYLRPKHMRREKFRRLVGEAETYDLAAFATLLLTLRPCLRF